MDSCTAYTLSILFIICLHSKVAIGDSSAVFLDSPTRSFFRHSSAQTASLSPSEIGAAASVLLGLAPPSTLTAASSSKLNEVITPNPFNRPRAVLMLEVSGAEGSQLGGHSDNSAFGTGLSVAVVGNEPNVDIHLSDENEVYVVSLNEESSDTECSDKELSDYALWLGGSYIEDASRPSSGELIIPAANGASLRFHLSERADHEYITSLLSIIKNVKKAIAMHEVLSNNENSPAELITGKFDGIKALQEHYGSEGTSQKGLEVFVASMSKIFDSLQAAYQGKIVGVIINGGKRSSESENIIHVTVNSRSSERTLQEAEAPSDVNIKIAEVLFVRTALAWITGIILLIATILGIHFLMNMSLTKDTLLYSNVKLD